MHQNHNPSLILMQCKRCGYCCIKYSVVIIKDLSKGPVEGNAMVKMTADRCPHLSGRVPGKMSCKAHDRPWFKKSPCGQFTQIEAKESPCRMGEYIMKMKPKDRLCFIS